jgi:hypothetical protein
MFRCLTERGTGHSEIRRPTEVGERDSIHHWRRLRPNSPRSLNVFRKGGPIVSVADGEETPAARIAGRYLSREF